WNGISGAIGGLYDKIKGALSGLVDKAKEALGIHSPSRVFRDEVGRYIPPGISEGIDKATPALQRDIAKRMQGVTAAAQSAFQPMTLRSAIGVEGSAPLPETGNGLADLASMLVELRGLRSDLQALHGDLGPTIAKYTPSMTIREEKRRLGLV
ncbi:phage tail protein, partial [Bifidobacterium longum]